MTLPRDLPALSSGVDVTQALPSMASALGETLGGTALAQTILAALGPSQNARLLRLQTPLGPNVLLAERMLGTETIGPRTPGLSPEAGFKFDVLALSNNAHLRLKDLIGQPVRLDLLTQQSRTELRPFHGHVTAFALLGSDGGLARYKLTIEPWLSFLSYRQDAWVCQDKTVPEIVDEVFADYQGQGKLAPAWRWELADASVYARRSLCIQYHESDLAFVQRLLAEEGLFCWFEHVAAEGESLGCHTLVIADHNGSFKPNVQPAVRYTQSASASFKEDSITRFDEARRVTPSALTTASWDHRTVGVLGAQREGDAGISPEGLSLMLRDQSGAYAYETSEHAERVVQRQLEAIQAPAYRHQVEGSFRQAACGTTLSVSGHPSVPAGQQWVLLTVQHRARNNLTADIASSLQSLVGRLPPSFQALQEQAPVAAEPQRSSRPSLFKGSANQTTEPLYQARFYAQDAQIPVRAAAHVTERGDLVFKRPQVSGTQTAVVVGLGEPVHTDRDGRIKIQFHWQRGGQSALRLDHSAGSNAPGDDSTGTWVRVAQSWAGANWGGHFTPRLGQEVVVSFIEDDIDRPVVIGSVFNGQGAADAQGNQIAAGAGTATGNAGPWFPGNQKAGEHQGHQHPQVFAGFKSQSLDASQSGSGGHNQVVFDDTPGQARTLLSSTTSSSWLQIGHLLQQRDNQRLAPRGHGWDLGTSALGAVRAGSGLHLSAYARSQGSQSAAQPAEARSAITQLENAAELTQTLADSAQKHNAKLAGEPAAHDLAVRLGQQASIDSLGATDSRGDSQASDSEIAAIQGGAGSVSAWSRPELLISAPGGIGEATPAHTVFSAGTNASLAAAQDINFEGQRNVAVVVKVGMSLFTYGKAQNAGKPNAETGLQLHAASGSVSVQAQASTLNLTADKSVAVSSVNNAITMGSPKHVLLTAGGASLRITRGSITLTTSGPAQFMAVMKELSGAGSALASLDLTKAGKLYDEKFCVKDQQSGDVMPFFKYRIETDSGDVIGRGITGADGMTTRVHTASAQGLRILADD